MNLRTFWPLAAIIAGAAVCWPVFMNHRVDAVQAAPTLVAAGPAPVFRDYEQRDALVAFWEGAVREHHTSDMFSPRELAGQYLQRYRERGDIDDVIRAQRMTEKSLAIMPRNIAAIDEHASIMLTLHQFREALADVNELLPYDPQNADFLAKRANLQMELGEYAAANATLARIGRDDRGTAVVETARSRYAELTGNLARSRALLADAMAQADGLDEESAQSRAWYHFRAGELAFEAGDNTGAIRDERAALALFPTYNLALKDLAKFELANGNARAALAAATKGAQVTPFAETLGYQADAQAALGDAEGAAATRAIIFAIERLGNAYHVNDRLLAVYYADHQLRPDDALAIAKREARVRGDEIYAQDTLAWAAARDGQWELARLADAKATRYGTQDPIVQYHAGVIAMHFGQRDAARRDFANALAANSHFHPQYAAAARKALAGLTVDER